MKKQIPHYTIKEFYSKKTKYCICIPVINEGSKIRKQLKQISRLNKVPDVIIADGGSTDGSLSTKFLRSVHVKTLLILQQKGRQGTQLRMAFDYALKNKYKGVITIDGNGKDGVMKIFSFIKALDEGYDLVQGSRFIRGGKAINTPLLRFLSIRFIHAPLISFAAHYWYTDTTNGFRAYSKRFLSSEKVYLFRDCFVEYELLFYLSVVAKKLGFKTKEIPVTRSYPKGKIPTKIHGLKSMINVLKTTINVTRGKYNY